MVTTELLGPASVAFPLSGAAQAGNRLYVASRNLSPTVLAVYDIDRREVVAQRTIPTGVGAWGMAAAGYRSVYLGQFGARGRANLFRYDRLSQQLETAAALDVDYIWSLSAGPDARVFGVSSPAMLFVYDPATGRADNLGVVDHTRETVRSIAATGSRLVIGGARQGRAMLLDIDRTSRTRRDILPSALTAHGAVYSLAVRGRVVAAGTTGPDEEQPALAVVDLGDLAASSAVVLPGEAVVDAVAIVSNVVYASARRSGALYRYERGALRARQVALPVPRAETRGLFRRGSRLVGASSTGSVFTYPLAGGAAEVTSLTDAGALPRPELVQSLAVGGGAVYAGGNFGFQRRDLATGKAVRFFVPGEPKDLVVAGGAVYLAIYPSGELWRLEPAAAAAKPFAQLPPDQLRPATVVTDDAGATLVVTTAGRIGGAWHTVAVGTGAVATYRSTFGAAEAPWGAVVHGGVAYLGGSAVDASLAAVDLASGSLLWRVERPAPGAGTFTGLALEGTRLHVLSARGTRLVLDAGSGAVLGTARIADRGGRLVATGGALYCSSGDAVMRIDPATGAVHHLARGLAPAIWGYPPLVADDEGWLYAVRGTDVIRLRD